MSGKEIVSKFQPLARPILGKNDPADRRVRFLLYTPRYVAYRGTDYRRRGNGHGAVGSLPDERESRTVPPLHLTGARENSDAACQMNATN